MLVELEYPVAKNVLRSLKVIVHSYAVDHLLADAQEAYRVYELMSIRRPGDIIHYIGIEPVEVTEYTLSRCLEKKPKEEPKTVVSLATFDGFFIAAWDDTEPEDGCWLHFRKSARFHDHLRSLFERVRAAQEALRSGSDPLIRHVIHLMETSSHSWDNSPDAPWWRTPSHYDSRTRPLRTLEYYAKLTELLARPDITSVRLYMHDDYQTERLVCTEQRVRASATGQITFEALPICMFANRIPASPGWGEKIMAFHEGTGYGMLVIVEDPGEAAYIKRMAEERERCEKYLLFHAGAPDITGYRRTDGPGWTLLEDLTDHRHHRVCGERMIADFVQTELKKAGRRP
ncbi:hypothetical protein DES53_101365 [Roseimicrobium gellanilyticum]|uniref:Uncharacterized protein n=1 Tax=Roseimicrobium gellanilyticum TaxID=748857 RepID=A0A366HW97_9BACT|nr:hypothetical protein [Roseimicrobium gellanilyticum]RBP47568.1 hypothetical protein DES53_101365 [Roseimicrobium gellanilyticum]